MIGGSCNEITHCVRDKKMDFAGMFKDVLFQPSRNEFSVNLCSIELSLS